MNLEQQVCSLELAKRLKELGVPQKSLFHHYHTDKGYWSILYGQLSKKDSTERYSAYSSAELGEILPKVIVVNAIEYGLMQIFNGLNKWRIFYGTLNDSLDFSHYDKTEANAGAKMLIYLLENGHVRAGDL